jgi:hypothetical protein
LRRFGSCDYASVTVLQSMFSGDQPMQEDDDNISTDDEKSKPANGQKTDKTIRKKLENYLDDLELKRQLKDWHDEDEDE